LDEAGFREWRRGSPLNRISFGQFQRNLGVARENLDSGKGGTLTPDDPAARWRYDIGTVCGSWLL